MRTIDQYTLLDGQPIPVGSQNQMLKVLHVLQRYRDVWAVVSEPPFLRVDGAALERRVANLERFAVFSHLWICHNMRPGDYSARLAEQMFGGGTTGGFAPSANPVVEGAANPQCCYLYVARDPLSRTGQPWIASGLRLIVLDGNQPYQYLIGELRVADRLSYPWSEHVDFSRVVELRNQYIAHYHRLDPTAQADLPALESLVDEVFVQNEHAFDQGEQYHQRMSVGLQPVAYAPPVLTKYDRLVHDASGEPQVEVVFALLHYEQALIEFNALRQAEAATRVNDVLRHGVNCVVSAAACIEAIANRLVLQQTGKHALKSDRRTPIEKINQAAAALVAPGGQYVGLQSGDAYHDTLNELRTLRNSFMHSRESPHELDPASRTSSALISVSSEACRARMRALRLAVGHIYAQLPALRAPIVTADNVTWLGELEVP